MNTADLDNIKLYNTRSELQTIPRKRNPNMVQNLFLEIFRRSPNEIQDPKLNEVYVNTFFSIKISQILFYNYPKQYILSKYLFC